MRSDKPRHIPFPPEKIERRQRELRDPLRQLLDQERLTHRSEDERYWSELAYCVERHRNGRH